MSESPSKSPSKFAWIKTMVTHKFFIISIVVILLFLGLSWLSKKGQEDVDYNQNFINKVKWLMDTSAQYTAMAKQDQNPTIQLIHITQALTMAQMAQKLVSAKDIEKIGGYDIAATLDYLEKYQNVIIQNIGQHCPNIKVEGTFSLNAWN